MLYHLSCEVDTLQPNEAIRMFFTLKLFDLEVVILPNRLSLGLSQFSTITEGKLSAIC